jgi:hypothetical protein
MKRLAWVLSMVLLLTACSSDSVDDTSTTDAPATTQAASSDDPVVTTAPAITAATTTAAPEAATPFDGSAVLYAGAATLPLTVDGTSRPQLSWSAVDGATSYSLLILAESGASVWAWSGSDTAVVVGGGAVDRSGLGARVPSASWALVLAQDSSGAVLAASAPTAVGPSS